MRDANPYRSWSDREANEAAGRALLAKRPPAAYRHTPLQVAAFETAEELRAAILGTAEHLRGANIGAEGQ